MASKIKLKPTILTNKAGVGLSPETYYSQLLDQDGSPFFARDGNGDLVLSIKINGENSISSGSITKDLLAQDLQTGLDAVSNAGGFKFSAIYDTEAALQADTTSRGGICLVTGTGEWYYYNGSSWVAGGLFQTAVEPTWATRVQNLVTKITTDTTSTTASITLKDNCDVTYTQPLQSIRLAIPESIEHGYVSGINFSTSTSFKTNNFTLINSSGKRMYYISDGTADFEMTIEAGKSYNCLCMYDGISVIFQTISTGSN